MSKSIPIEERDLSKLPKWAANEITRLRSNVEYWQKKSQEIASPEASNTFIVRYIAAEVPLGNNPLIRFNCGPHEFRDYIDVQVNDNEIRVQAGATLLVRHDSSNVAHLSVAPR